MESNSNSGANETELVTTLGINKTGLFDTTFCTRDVAQTGYNDMRNDKLDVGEIDFYAMYDDDNDPIDS